MKLTEEEAWEKIKQINVDDKWATVSAPHFDYFLSLDDLKTKRVSPNLFIPIVALNHIKEEWL